jgi:Tfp pilus assembly protein PilZ
MEIIKVRFKNRNEFLEHYSADGEAGSMFCPTTTPLEEGQGVVVDINFPGLPNKTLIRGTVVWWRQALPRLRVRAGAKVAFDPKEADKRDFLMAVAEEGADQFQKRRHARLPVDVPVRWRPAQDPDFREGGLDEISVGGALLKSEEMLPIGSEVIVELLLPGASAPISVAGKVTYNNPDEGNGIKFLYRDGGGSRRIREMLRRIQTLE